MNNNTYSASSLPQQLTHQNAQAGSAYMPAHAHMQQQQQQQQHHHHHHHQQQLPRSQLNQVSGNLASSTTAAYFDTRNLDNTFANSFPNTATNRYFANTGQTTLPASLPNPHNTILITNNFSQPTLSTNTNVATVAPQALQTQHFNNDNMGFLTGASAAVSNNNINIINNSNNNNNNNRRQTCGLYNISGGINRDTQFPQIFQQSNHEQQPNAAVQYAVQQQLQRHFSNFAPTPTPQQLQQLRQTPLTLHFDMTQPVAQTVNRTAVAAAQQYFMQHADVETNKLLQPLVTTTPPTTIATNNTKMATPSSTVSANGNNSSTVVLDRINICINNHYNDSLSNNITNTKTATNSNNFVNNSTMPVLSCATTTNTTSTTCEIPEQILAKDVNKEDVKPQQQQQLSPIIPIIQHNNNNNRNNIANNITSSHKLFMKNNYTNDKITTIHIIDEPDSTTTTTHTPPSTPDNNIITIETSNNNINNNHNKNHDHSDKMSSPLEQSPSTTTTTNILNIENNNDRNSENEATTTIIVIDTDDNENDNDNKDKHENVILIAKEEKDVEEIASNLLIPSPPPPPPMTASTSTTNIPGIQIGEDVLLKRHDNRFYLGTVIDSAGHLFLVRFDDKSEQWCIADEMRKLGGGVSNTVNNDNNNSNTDNNSMQCNDKSQSQMCLACKQQQPNDIVECCERCGRGYHRGCTTEVYAGSGDWLCKR